MGKRAASVIAAKREEIYSTIYDAVMDHRMPPGTKLPEATFSEYFDVTRTTFRRALHELSENQIVELHPNKCAVIATPTKEESHEIFDVRRLLEAHVIRQAAQLAPRKEIENLERLAKEEICCQKQGKRRIVLRMSSEFHFRLVESLNNQTLTQIMQRLVTRTSLIVALYYTPGVTPCPIYDHSDIIKMVSKGDGENGAKLMIQHLHHVENELRFSSSAKNVDLGEMLAKD